MATPSTSALAHFKPNKGLSSPYTAPQSLQDRFNSLCTHAENSEFDSIPLAELASNSHTAHCPRATALTYNAGAHYLHANTVTFSTTNSTELNTYKVGQSPKATTDQARSLIPFDSSTPIGPAKAQQPLSELSQGTLLHALQSSSEQASEGIFQFVSPRAHRISQASGSARQAEIDKKGPSKETPLAQQIEEALLNSQGRPVSIGNGMHILNVQKQALTVTDGSCDHASYVLTIQAQSGSKRQVRITQVAPRFDGKSIEADQLELANNVYEAHQKASGNACASGQVLSYAGIGRSASLVVYQQIKQLASQNKISEKNLHDTIDEFIRQGKQQRGPRFIHTVQQYEELLKACQQLLAPQHKRNTTATGLMPVEPSSERDTSATRYIQRRPPANPGGVVAQNVAPPTNRPNITIGLENCGNSCYANSTFKFLASIGGQEILRQIETAKGEIRGKLHEAERAHLLEIREKRGPEKKHLEALHKIRVAIINSSKPALDAVGDIVSQLINSGVPGGVIDANEMRRHLKGIDTMINTTRQKVNKDNGKIVRPSVEEAFGEGKQEEAGEFFRFLGDLIGLEKLRSQQFEIQRTYFSETNQFEAKKARSLTNCLIIDVTNSLPTQGHGVSRRSFQFEDIFKILNKIDKDVKIKLRDEDRENVTASESKQLFVDIDSLEKLVVDLAPYDHNGNLITINGVNFDHLFKIPAIDKLTNKKYELTLRADDVVCHAGTSIKGGHYREYSRNYATGGWTDHNDRHVSQQARSPTAIRPTLISFRIIEKKEINEQHQ